MNKIIILESNVSRDVEVEIKLKFVIFHFKLSQELQNQKTSNFRF